MFRGECKTFAKELEKILDGYNFKKEGGKPEWSVFLSYLIQQLPNPPRLPRYKMIAFVNQDDWSDKHVTIEIKFMGAVEEPAGFNSQLVTAVREKFPTLGIRVRGSTLCIDVTQLQGLGLISDFQQYLFHNPSFCSDRMLVANPEEQQLQFMRQMTKDTPYLQNEQTLKHDAQQLFAQMTSLAIVNILQSVNTFLLVHIPVQPLVAIVNEYLGHYTQPKVSAGFHLRMLSIRNTSSEIFTTYFNRLCTSSASVDPIADCIYIKPEAALHPHFLGELVEVFQSKLDTKPNSQESKVEARPAAARAPVAAGSVAAPVSALRRHSLQQLPPPAAPPAVADREQAPVSGCCAIM